MEKDDGVKNVTNSVQKELLLAAGWTEVKSPKSTVKKDK